MKVLAIVPQKILNSAALKSWIEQRCTEAGAEVEWLNVSENADQFVERFNAHQNVIAWNCRMPPEWLARDDRNVLHLDNSLLSQKRGVFVDHGGCFGRSNLRMKQTWKENRPANPEFFAKREFGWDAFSGGNAEGPVLVALQCRDDSALTWDFPLAKGEADKIAAVMQWVTNCLPAGRRVLIRPHPRELKKYPPESFMQGRWRKDFVMQTEGKFHELLPQCSALVTVNSTCAHEAILLGVPVATLGTGAFSGSGTTHECYDNVHKLKQFFEFKPDVDACRAYTRAILARHFLPYDIKADRGNAEFQSWIDNLK